MYRMYIVYDHLFLKNVKYPVLSLIAIVSKFVYI